MKIKCTYIIAILLAVIVTSVNVHLILRKKNIEIHNLKLTVEELKIRNNRLETSIDFSNRAGNFHFEHEYVLYFPKEGCSSCLEDIVLILSKKIKIWNNILLYFDTKETEDIISYLIDSYNLEFDYEIGEPLYEKGLNDILFFKCENSLIKNILVLNQDNISNLDNLIKSIIIS